MVTHLQKIRHDNRFVCRWIKQDFLQKNQILKHKTRRDVKRKSCFSFSKDTKTEKSFWLSGSLCSQTINSLLTATFPVCFLSSGSRKHHRQGEFTIYMLITFPSALYSQSEVNSLLGRDKSLNVRQLKWPSYQKGFLWE